MFVLPGLIYLLFPIPLLILELIIPHSVLSIGNGGWGFLYYLWFLIAGFLIASSDKLAWQIRDNRGISLLLAIILTILYLYQCFSPSIIVFPAQISPWIHSSLRFVCAWSWLFSILGFGMRYLSFDRPILGRLNEGVLPFYILHQTVLLWVGYYIMSMETHDGLKWVIVAIVSFSLIICLYMLIIRKIDLIRFLFGMKTSHPFFQRLRKRNALFVLHLFYIGLIVIAVNNPLVGSRSNRSPMSITFDKGKDIILDSQSIINQSSTGVRLIRDDNTSTGEAIEFSSGALPKPVTDPQVYVEMHFYAPAGSYIVWLRGKSDTDSIYTDSIWLQVDTQVGTKSGRMLGNWLNIHPADTWAWASDGVKPVTILLKHSGNHTLRIQPRQTPHQIDQVWLSRFQYRIPDTVEIIE